MLKALIKKQYAEMFRSYFVNQKTGKARSKKGMVMYFILFGFLMLFLGVVFFGMGMLIGPDLFDLKMEWLYFAVIGMISVMLGVFGSVFNTYAGMYMAKDNDFLISMPIPAGTILLSRIMSVAGMALLYSGLVWLPGSIVYWIFGNPSALSIIYTILLTIVITLLVAVLTCALGWVIALIASRLKNKNFLVVIISIVFFGLYYMVCFRMSDLLMGFVTHAQEIGSAVEKWANVIYQIGQAACGNTSSMLLLSGVAIVLSLVTYKVLSVSFVRIVTRSTGEKKTVYREKASRQNSLEKALFQKELKRFTSSSTYMLNCGLGLVFLPVITVFAFVKQGTIHEVLFSFGAATQDLLKLVPFLIVVIVSMTMSLNVISTPSISLEGKNIWILQTLPIDPGKILSAKLDLHIRLNLLPTVICTILLCLIFDLDPVTEILMVVYVSLIICFNAVFGLFIGLKRPNLIWTNETSPIKQSLNIILVPLAIWILLAGTVAGAYFLTDVMDLRLFLTGCDLILAVLVFGIYRWLMTGGKKVLAHL